MPNLPAKSRKKLTECLKIKSKGNYRLDLWTRIRRSKKPKPSSEENSTQKSTPTVKMIQSVTTRRIRQN